MGLAEDRRDPEDRGAAPGRATPKGGGGSSFETAALLALAVVWTVLWFWTFSLAYSRSFFAYDRHSRIPVFVAALMGALGIFASAAWQWRSRRSPWAACLRHVGSVVLSLCPLVATSALLHRAPPPWRPSADDAMGIGIDFLLLVGAGIGTLVALGGALALRSLWGRGAR